MKICITSEGNNLDAKVDSRFGRCAYFIFADSDTLKFEAVQNPNLEGMGGIGVKSGQLVAEKGVKVVISGNVGPSGFQTLQTAGIEVATVLSGTVREALDKYKKGKLKSEKSATVEAKFNPDR